MQATGFTVTRGSLYAIVTFSNDGHVTVTVCQGVDGPSILSSEAILPTTTYGFIEWVLNFFRPSPSTNLHDHVVAVVNQTFDAAALHLRAQRAFDRIVSDVKEVLGAD